MYAPDEIQTFSDSKSTMATIPQIFIVFFRVGAFTLGGGWAMVSVLRHEIIVKRTWISEDDFSQELAIATTLPGAMVLNFSMLSGHRMRGAPGAAAAFLGAVLPSFIAITMVAMFLFPFFSHSTVAAFLRGAAAAVAGLLAHVAFTMFKPMMARATYLIAAIVAALLASIPAVNPIFALILVTSAVFWKLKAEKPAPSGVNKETGADGGKGET
jgi:chromate transporter